MFLPFRINKSFLCSYMYVWNKVYMYTTHCVKLMTNSFKIIPMKFSKFFLKFFLYLSKMAKYLQSASTMYNLKLSKLSEVDRTLTSSLALCITCFGSIGHGCRLVVEQAFSIRTYHNVVFTSMGVYKSA